MRLFLLTLTVALTGCAQLLGPAGWVAQNQVPLQNLLLLTATVATTESAYLQTKQLIGEPNGTTDTAPQK